jgi:hypothetical protein
MIEHRGRETGLLDHRIFVEQRAHPSHRLPSHRGGGARRRGRLPFRYFTTMGDISERCRHLEFEHLHVPYVRQRTQLLLNVVRHDLIDTYNGNGVLPRGMAPQVERRDIDVSFPQHCA